MPAGSQGYQNGSGYNRNEGDAYGSYSQGSGQQGSYIGANGGQQGVQQGGHLPVSTHPQYSPSSSAGQQYSYSSSSSPEALQYGHSASSLPGVAPDSNYSGQYGQSSPSPSSYSSYNGQYGQGGAQGTPGSAGGSPNWPTAPQWNPQTAQGATGVHNVYPDNSRYGSIPPSF